MNEGLLLLWQQITHSNIYPLVGSLRKTVAIVSFIMMVTSPPLAHDKLQVTIV